MSRKVRIAIVPPVDGANYWKVRRIAQSMEGGSTRRVNWLPVIAIVALMLILLFAAATHPAAGATVYPARRICLRYRTIPAQMRYCVSYSAWGIR
jgi:hypothetical protein